MSNTWTGHAKIHHSCLDWPCKTCCGMRKGDKYELNDTLLTITHKHGHCCWYQEDVDNVQRAKITDADLKSINAPGIHMLCCGSVDEVTIKTGGKETKIMTLPDGEGTVLTNKILGRE